ncbi:MAG: TonB-dependent receptor [Saprospiraceae bacterium]|nr:TonB-dependent receptor [Saprospiraceae bacterium]
MSNTEGEIIRDGEIYLEEYGEIASSDLNGVIELDIQSNTSLICLIYAPGYQTFKKEFNIEGDTLIRLTLESLKYKSETAVITDRGHGLWLSKLRDVEKMAIYASKKSELIILDEIGANLSTNNARQLFSRVPGLNIWDNDGAGLQLGIGVRGLDPNRTAHFNTRQNGYDISADALGYPESYYTPPSEAIDEIEIVRGAASLQYGPQLGGLLNFDLKDGKVGQPVLLDIGLTGGSYDYLDGYLSAQGEIDGLSYFAFGKYKQGSGWRENSDFEQRVGIGRVNYRFNPKLEVGMEATFMSYLAQQPGGLVDFEFENAPQSSKRSRNWFKVNWNLYSLTFDYEISGSTNTNLRTFHLDARRQALGNLGPIHRPDSGRERDLIDGQYDNWGMEWRLMHRYELNDLFQHILIGARFYSGFTTNRQGLADDGSGPDFDFLNPDELESSDYDFPSRNMALFAEHLFNITDKWSVTPGARFESIFTSGEGYYKNRVISGSRVIFEEKIFEERSRMRNFVLLGLGTSYRPDQNIEIYANFSQNYRSINFSDLIVTNPNLVIDQDLKDESGYNTDLGIRGLIFDKMRFDLSLFYLRYMDRIGIGEKIVKDDRIGERAVSYRTNIGDAAIGGLEGYVRYDLLDRKIRGNDLSLDPFLNISLIESKYLDGLSGFQGNEVELVAPLMFKFGMRATLGRLGLSYLFSYTHRHYSDATNAIRVADATRGIIPSYWVHDLTLSCNFKKSEIKFSVNNALDRAYFTRRATGYPGPGIIPAEGRTFYLTISHRFFKD